MKYESDVDAFAKSQQALRSRLEPSATVVRAVVRKKLGKDERPIKLRWAYELDTGELSVSKRGVKVNKCAVPSEFLGGDQGTASREVRKIIRDFKVERDAAEKKRKFDEMRNEFSEAETEYFEAKRRVTIAAEALWHHRKEMPGIEVHIRGYLGSGDDC